MKQRFRLYRRKGGIYYLHDSQSGKQTSLGTSERTEAIELFSARMRIPAKADTDSENNRTPIPIQIGQFSERSDARVLAIKNCPQ